MQNRGNAPEPCSVTQSTGAVTETTSLAKDNLPGEEPPSEPVANLTAAHPRNYAWAELMRRVWALDVLECPRCLARTRILAAIHPPDATRKILDCLGLPSRAPPVAAAVSEPTVQLDWF